jgi:acetyl esterase/lipase
MKLRSVEATQQFRELKILITLLALLACAPGGARAAQDPSLPSSSKKSVIYKTPHGQEQSVEVHFPSGHHPGSKKAPGVLLFHGGGWLARLRGLE